MRKTKNTIKINGRTYDAITGELLHADKVSIVTPVSTPIKPAHPAKPASSKKPVTSRHAAKHAKRTPQQAKTLMRRSVRKPSHAANSHDKTHLKSTSKVATRSSVIAVKKSARRIDERRLIKAKNVPKSQKIAKFNTSNPVAHKSTPQVHHPATPQPIQHHVTTTHKRRTPHQPAVHRAKTTEDLLQEALHHATSHKQPAPRRHLNRSQRAIGLSALVVTTGMLLALVATQSAPTVKMRIASAKAGFQASLPGNSPAGFHLGDLSYGAGAVAINYESNSDQDRKFSITQKTSAWDSTTLRDAFVADTDKNFRVVEDGGLTIYLYGDNNATWVNDGVWYQVQGNGSLSDRQLVDIAKSL